MSYMQPSDYFVASFLLILFLLFLAWHLASGIRCFGWRFAVGAYASVLGAVAVTALLAYAAARVFQ